MLNVVVTGADRGLGYALAEQLAERGERVLAGQFLPEWPELARLAERYPGRVTLLPLDVGSAESIAAFVERLGGMRVDMLISNAGISGTSEDDLLADGWSPEGMRRVYRVNCVGGMRLTRALLPLMEGGLKRLCYVSSEAGSIAVCTRDAMYGYCMSKTALNRSVRRLHAELSGQGYTFRLYHPGWMRTYMMGQKSQEGKLEADESARAALAQMLEPQACEHVLRMKDVYGATWPY